MTMAEMKKIRENKISRIVLENLTFREFAQNLRNREFLLPRKFSLLKYFTNNITDTIH